MDTSILYYSFQAIQYILWMISFHFIFKPRFRPALTVGLTILTFFLFALTSSMTRQESALRVISCTLSVLLTMQLIFRGKWYHKLAFSVVLLLIMVFAEFLSFIVLPDELNAQTVFNADFSTLLTVYLCDLFGNFVLLFISTLLAWQYKQRYAGRMVGREWMLLLLFPISQYYLLSGWFTADNAVENFSLASRLAGAILICIAADIALAVTLFAVARSAELRTRNDMLEKQINSQQGYYQNLAGTYEDLRLLRHDIGNHMYTVKILLEDGRADEAREYAEEMREKSRFSSRLGSCDNPVVDSFLSRRREELEAAGFSLELSVSLPQRCGIANSDLICILGNLLDNAAEACAEMENKTIWLQMRYAAPYLHIETGNPSPKTPERKKRRIPALERGLGFASLQHLAKKYDGEFSTEQKDGTFYAALTLRGEVG